MDKGGLLYLVLIREREMGALLHFTMSVNWHLFYKRQLAKCINNLKYYITLDTEILLKMIYPKGKISKIHKII